MSYSTDEIILKIAELKSLARTAEYFSYSPSRISQILKAAEEEYGVALFLRGKTGLVPTAACQALLPALQNLINDRRRLREELDGLKNIRTGTIRIGSFTSLSCHWLPQRLKAFSRRYPGIRFELKLGEGDQIADWVRQGVIDVGLMSDPAAEDLRFIPLLEDPFVVVVPQGHPLAGCGSVTCEQLRGEQFILLEPEDNRAMENQMRKEGFRPHVQYRVKDDYTIMSLVESGLGVSILPGLVLNRTPYRICALELMPPCIRTTGLVLGAQEHVSPATDRLVSFLLRGEEQAAAEEEGEE